jgi:hypothetical protein
MAEQTKMSEFSEKLAEKLSHFVRVDRIIQKLNSPSISVMSEVFPKLLDEIDESSAFLEQHVRILFKQPQVEEHPCRTFYRLNANKLTDNAVNFVQGI